MVSSIHASHLVKELFFPISLEEMEYLLLGCSYMQVFSVNYMYFLRVGMLESGRDFYRSTEGIGLLIDGLPAFCRSTDAKNLLTNGAFLV